MINSQPRQDPDIKKLNEELVGTNQALTKINEAEVKLYEIKERLEVLTNIYHENEPRRKKMLKDAHNVFLLYKDIETILVEQVLSQIRPGKQRVDDNLYRNYLQKEKLISSFKLFKDEVASVLSDSNNLQDYKSFNEVFREPRTGMFEFPYELLVGGAGSAGGVLDFLAIKEKLLLVRFDKSLEFHELPETFFICFIRMDLITVTLSFRKIRQSKPNQPQKIEIESVDNVAGDGNRVALFSVVYSHLFDSKGEKLNFNTKPETFYINPKSLDMNDQDVANLIETLKENQGRLSLPCVYPSLTIFQKFSYYICERLEKIWRTYQTQIKGKKDRLEDILKTILRAYVEEFVESIEDRCIYCKKKFEMGSKSMKMLPPLSTKINNRKEKIGSTHLSCKKLFETMSGEGPQILVKIDCADESDYFLQSLNEN